MEIRWTERGDRDGYVACVQAAGLSPTPAQLDFYLESRLVKTYVAQDSGRIVGTGFCVAYGGGTGWIGLITVQPEYQRKGLGRTLTEWGIHALRDLGVRTVMLAATEAGRPLYERMGFEAMGEHLTMAGAGLSHPPRDVRLRPMFDHDWPAVEMLDMSATGEDRGALLRSMRTCYVLVSNDGRITGFHSLAPWGGGASVASEPEAGQIMIDLARGLRGDQPMRVFVPAANTECVSYLTAAGFETVRRSRHMVLGAAPSPFTPGRIWGAFSLGLG